MEKHTKRKAHTLRKEIEELEELVGLTERDPCDPQMIFARRMFQHCIESRKGELAELTDTRLLGKCPG